MFTKQTQTLDFRVFDVMHKSLVVKHAQIIKHKALCTPESLDWYFNPGVRQRLSASLSTTVCCSSLVSCQHMPWEAEVYKNKTQVFKNRQITREFRFRSSAFSHEKHSNEWKRLPWLTLMSWHTCQQSKNTSRLKVAMTSDYTKKEE